MSYQSPCQGHRHWLSQTSLCLLNYVIFNNPQKTGDGPRSSLSAIPFTAALHSCPMQPTGVGVGVGLESDVDRCVPELSIHCTSRKLIRWLNLCVCMYRTHYRTLCKPELKRACVHRIVYSSSGLGSEEAVPPKKPTGAHHGNDVDVGDVIKIKDSLDGDHKLLPDAHVGVVRLPPLPPSPSL